MSGQALIVTPRRGRTMLRRTFVLAYIESYWAANWTSPTVREIGEAIGVSSPATVHDYLERLVQRGDLEVKRVSPRRVLYRTTRSVSP